MVIKNYFDFPLKQRLTLYRYYLKHVKYVWVCYSLLETKFVFTDDLKRVIGYAHELTN